ncbi:MAG TPA: hypothetical protein VNQ80_15365 [Parapedobacter sp.]|uniref:hypothetical protein n=1 Tax=Parapedobacter sp. TaxID=1958893 RepID=UPI002C9595BC|nr:hypothetical protein [Parapedobacter sp.]HWK58721.1 hypothetical protein [Parapedobacter sp.]
MSDIVRITVKPHVRRYLLVQFGPQLLISDRNYAAGLLRSMFEPFAKDDPGRIRPCLKHSLGEMYDVCMGETGLRKYGGYLSAEKLKLFSEAIDLLIKQEMYRWCHHPDAPDTKVDYNIRRFQDFYGFQEEHLSFDNLKRWYYRERQRLEVRTGVDENGKPGLVIPMMIEDFDRPVVGAFGSNFPPQMSLFG